MSRKVPCESMLIEKESKSIKGGKRPGAGRKPGVPNKATQEQREAIIIGWVSERCFTGKSIVIK